MRVGAPWRHRRGGGQLRISQPRRQPQSVAVEPPVEDGDGLHPLRRRAPHQRRQRRKHPRQFLTIAVRKSNQRLRQDSRQPLPERRGHLAVVDAASLTIPLLRAKPAGDLPLCAFHPGLHRDLPDADPLCLPRGGSRFWPQRSLVTQNQPAAAPPCAGSHRSAIERDVHADQYGGKR